MYPTRIKHSLSVNLCRGTATLGYPATDQQPRDYFLIVVRCEWQHWTRIVNVNVSPLAIVRFLHKKAGLLPALIILATAF